MEGPKRPSNHGHLLIIFLVFEGEEGKMQGGGELKWAWKCCLHPRITKTNHASAFGPLSTQGIIFRPSILYDIILEYSLRCVYV